MSNFDQTKILLSPALSWVKISLFSLLSVHSGCAISYGYYIIPDSWVNSWLQQNFVIIGIGNSLFCTGLSCYSRWGPMEICSATVSVWWRRRPMSIDLSRRRFSLLPRQFAASAIFPFVRLLLSAGSWSSGSHRGVNFCGPERSCFPFCLTRCLCFTGWVSEAEAVALEPGWNVVTWKSSDENNCIKGINIMKWDHLVFLHWSKSAPWLLPVMSFSRWEPLRTAACERVPQVLLRCGGICGPSDALSSHCYHLLFAFLTCFLFTSHLPERLAPGRFDYFGMFLLAFRRIRTVHLCTEIRVLLCCVRSWKCWPLAENNSVAHKRRYRERPVYVWAKRAAEELLRSGERF